MEGVRPQQMKRGRGGNWGGGGEVLKSIFGFGFSRDFTDRKEIVMLFILFLLFN